MAPEARRHREPAADAEKNQQWFAAAFTYAGDALVPRIRMPRYGSSRRDEVERTRDRPSAAIIGRPLTKCVLSRTQFPVNSVGSQVPTRSGGVCGT